jgi:hypothetical protein
MRIRIRFKKTSDPKGIIHTKWYDEATVADAISNLAWRHQRADRIVSIDVKCEGILAGKNIPCNRIVPEGKGCYCPQHKPNTPAPLPSCPSCGSTVACGCDENDPCYICGSTICNCED